MDKKFAEALKRYQGADEGTFTCPVCGWYRNVRKDVKRYDFIDHPQWGRVSWATAAHKDIKTHDCETYQQALKMVKASFLFLKDAS